MAFIKLEDIEKYDLKKLNRLYKKYYENGFYKILKLVNLDINFEKAKGIRLYDFNGNEYLDFLSSFGCMSLGHNNDEVFKSIEEYKDRPNIMQQSINIFNGILANNIASLTDYELTKCHFTNCGAEAVEEALKLVFISHKDSHIIYFENSYHGKTLGALSALGTKVKENYYTMEERFHQVEYGDIKEVKRLCRQYKVGGIILEPVQGEGGIIIPKKSFLKDLRKLCDKEDIFLILDEIQTGLGRCGEIFCYKKFDIIPDILCISKTLSGGYIPIGAIVVKEEIWKKTYGKMKNGELITTTFSGNTLASIAAIKTLTIIKEDNLVVRSRKIGKYSLKRLKCLEGKYGVITDVRGMGLLIGIEFGGLKTRFSEKTIKIIMATIVSKLLNEHNIITTVTGNCPSVLRFEPPFIVEKDEIDYFVDSLDRVISEMDSICNLIVNTTKNILR